MRVIRTIMFMTVLVVNTFIGGIATILLGFFHRYSRFALYWVVKPWAQSLLWVSGTRLTVDGVENVDPQQSYIILSNHQSHMDIPVLVAGLPNNFRIIAKKELFRIPFFGQAMRGYGIFEIDRSNRQRAIATLREAAEIARTHNVSILAFPEGTRSEDGQLKPFKKGPFMMALDAQLPILPVSVSGTYPILPKGSIFMNGGQHVHVTIHPPILVNSFDYQNREHLMDETYQRIASGILQYES